MSSSKAAFSNSELFVLKKKQKQRNQDPPKLLREVFNIHFSAEGWAGNFNQITIFVYLFLFQHHPSTISSHLSL